MRQILKYSCASLNVMVSRQRKEFRASGGKLKIWGKEANYITAKYTTEDSKEHTSLLLASGWWGVARYRKKLFRVTKTVFYLLLL